MNLDVPANFVPAAAVIQKFGHRYWYLTGIKSDKILPKLIKELSNIRKSRWISNVRLKILDIRRKINGYSAALLYYWHLLTKVWGAN